MKPVKKWKSCNIQTGLDTNTEAYKAISISMATDIGYLSKKLKEAPNDQISVWCTHNVDDDEGDYKARKRFHSQKPISHATFVLVAPANLSLHSLPWEQKPNKLKSFPSFIILSAAIFYALAPY
jgi:hypothetical protein